MRKLSGVLTAMMVASAAMVSGQAPDARKVLADMQAALGGVDKVAAVKTLTAKGTIKRVTPRGTTENETELSMALPDKYVTRTVVAGKGSMAVFRNAGFNGDGLISQTDAPPNLAQGMRARLGSDRVGGAAAREPSEEERAAAAQRQLLVAKMDFARLALGLLGSTYEGFPLQLTYGGEAESGDGVAHIIDAKGAGDFSAQLFVDASSHLPLMVMWSTAGAGPNAGRMIERRIYYSDFTPVDGLNLPHTLRLAVNGNTTQETTFTEIHVNQNIDSKIFDISK
jgi:hypothetical protein